MFDFRTRRDVRSPYEHFAEVVGRGGGHGQALQDFLVDGPRLSVCNAECCEGKITAEEVIEVFGDCPWQKSPSYDGLPNEFYSSIPDLFWHQLASVYTLWQQNGSIPKVVIKKDPDRMK